MSSPFVSASVLAGRALRSLKDGRNKTAAGAVAQQVRERAAKPPGRLDKNFFPQRFL
jgi:hypothetical protein